MKKPFSIMLCLVLSLCLCGTVFADAPVLLNENRGSTMTIELSRIYQGSRFYDIMGATGGPEQYKIYLSRSGLALITIVHNDTASNASDGEIMMGLDVMVKGPGMTLQQLAYQYKTLIPFSVSPGWYSIDVLANRFSTADATYTIEVTYM